MSDIDPILSVGKYLSQFEEYYPDILAWFSVVKKELREGKRQIFAVVFDSEIQGLAITKNGQRAKLCHISVCKSARDFGLGYSLMEYALQDMIHNGAEEIRVTTGEKVLKEHRSFFSAAGFHPVDWQLNRYRRGFSEILWRQQI